MSKNLVIVESPTKARTLQRFLGNEYAVEASVGHINNLESGYGAKYTGPVAGVDENFEPIWGLEKGAITRINNLNKLAKDCETIYLAADPDREGEGIAYHVANALIEKKQPKEKFKRVVFHEITEKAVKEAFKNAGNLNMDLVDAHIGRRLVDRLVGFSLSGLTSSLLRLKRLSVGRVQSVAVSIIKDKEDEIDAFIPKEYWNLTGIFSKNKIDYSGKLNEVNGVSGKNLEIPSENEANEIQNEITKQKYKILSIKSNERKTKPRAPFTTSSLQQDSSSRLRLSPSRTMAIAQQLFQGINLGNGEEGLITYMRTDSTALSNESLNEINKYITKSYGDNYYELRKYKTKSANAQEAHEAIRPTSISKTPDSIKSFLDDDQFKLYDLIWKRTVASQMTESINKKTTIITSSENEKYKFKSDYDELTFDGYKKLFPEKESESMPPVSESDIVDLDKLNKEQKFTQHPPRYSEASLIKTLEDLGIGRPSTYASILNTIKDQKYVWVINRSIYLSPIGKVLVEEIKKDFSNEFMDYKFTEKMENDLDSISNGTLKRSEFIKSFWKNFEPVRNNYEKRSEENPRNPSEYNFIKTNIICSSKSPCVNSETGKEFQENDQPLGTKSLNSSLEKLPRMVWIRFRNNKGDGAFLACEDRECKVTADESAWAGFGRRRARTMEALKISMKEKSI
ncbi:MAG: type I DNA topoisomerase, partial [Chloroflexota bacterium]|nr:type I DNA topoisomerase [Chloroflexota bacterium]